MTALRLDEACRETECVVCTNSFRPSQTTTLPCGDTWCLFCMAQRFEEATINEGAWQVRCCRTEITMETVRPLLSLSLRKLFAAKCIEWSDTNRGLLPRTRMRYLHSQGYNLGTPCSLLQLLTLDLRGVQRRLP